jgi:S1-C subfamily serine protease
MRYVIWAVFSFVLMFLVLLVLFCRTFPAIGATSVYVSAGTGHGSGVYIGNGLIVTAGHVAQSADLSGQEQINNGGSNVTATVLWYDAVADVALLKLDKDLMGLRAADLACGKADPVVGDAIEAIANPLNLVNIHTYGRVAHNTSTYADNGDEVALIGDITIGPGNSGGGVFDAKGKLAGIVVAGAVATVFGNASLLPLTYIIPRSIICKELAGNHEAPKFGS